MLERYAEGFGPASRFRSWSMAKSVTQCLVGVLCREQRLKLDAPAPVPGTAGSVLVEIEGYYRPLLEAAGEPQTALFERLVHEPGALARYALTGVQPDTRYSRGP